MILVNLFSRKNTFFKLVSSPNEEGRGPDNLFEVRYSAEIRDKRPIDEGMEPEREYVSHRNKLSSEVRRPIAEEIVPEKDNIFTLIVTTCISLGSVGLGSQDTPNQVHGRIFGVEPSQSQP